MLYYKIVQRGNPRDMSTKKFYPTHATKGKIEIRELAERVAARAGHSVGSVYCVLTDMVDVIVENVKRSNSCSIAELGGFRLTLNGDGTDTFEDYNIKNVYNTKLMYEPSVRIKNALKTSVVKISPLPTYQIDLDEAQP